MKKHFYTLMIIGIAMGTACASERNIDRPCNYITDKNGKTPTYRQALSEALDCFYEQSQCLPLKENVQKVLPQAIELFGQGTQSLEVLENRKFNYTFFKETKCGFLNALNKITLPFIVNEEGQKYVYSMRLYDIDYALSGILQYHAYQSTGGDS